MDKLILIDAHAIIHRTYHALPPLTSPGGAPTGALYGLAQTLLKILREEKPDYAAAAFDRPEKTFREEIFPEYKAQRPKAEDALISQLKEARVLFRKLGIAVVEYPGVEADDVIGTLAEKCAVSGVEIGILTGDMDVLQLVDDKRNVYVLALGRKTSDIKKYDEEKVVEKFGVPARKLPDYKGLAGDASDNIPGVRGVGPKGASNLISRYGSLEGVYANLYELSEKEQDRLREGREDAFLSRRLAAIRRDVPLGVDLKSLKFEPKWGEFKDYLAARGMRSIASRL